MDVREANWLVSKHLNSERRKLAVAKLAEVVGTDDDALAIALCGAIEENGFPKSIEEIGKVTRALITLARRKALADERHLRNASHARTKRLLEGLQDEKEAG